MTTPSRGETFAASVRDEFTLNQAESILVDEVAAVLDVIDEMPASRVTELRQQRILLSRLLSQLALPESGGDAPRPKSTSTKARKAARARWNKEVDRAG